jgi:hypothetical protein
MSYDVAAMLDELNPCEMVFDVAFSSHDALREGDLEAEVVRVAVHAHTFAEGEYVACQKAGAYQAMKGSDYLMPTATYPVI